MTQDGTRRRDAQMWDERYAGPRHHHHGEPDDVVQELVGGWPPGRALDLGAGEGRHALWLASRGWRVTAVDFSAVGLGRGRAEAQRRGLDSEWVVADALEWQPAEGTAYDLVLMAFMHLPRDVVARSADWLAPGGALVVVGHALRNLTEGVGGPSDPAILHTTDQLRAAAGGLVVERCEEVVRPTHEGNQIDVVLLARAPVAAHPAGTGDATPRAAPPAR